VTGKIFLIWTNVAWTNVLEVPGGVGIESKFRVQLRTKLRSKKKYLL